MALILGSYQSRTALRNLVVDVVEQLQAARVPALLAPKPVAKVEATNSGSDVESAMDLSDLIRNLVRQALQVLQQQQQQRSDGVQTERSMGRFSAQFLGAESPEELFQLLKAVLSEIIGQVYLVVDLGVLGSEQQQASVGNDKEEGFRWLESFLAFFAELSERSNSVSALSKARVKALLVSYDACPSSCLSAASQSGYVVQARTEVVTARNRKARRNNTPKTSQLKLNLSKPAKGSKPVGAKGATLRRLNSGVYS